MASFRGITACNSAKVNDAGKVKDLMDLYVLTSDVNWKLENGFFTIYGPDTPYVELADLGGDECQDDSDHFEDFLRELAPFLENPLIVQSIGNEKCTFPLMGQSLMVMPDGRLFYRDLPWDERGFTESPYIPHVEEPVAQA